MAHTASDTQNSDGPVLIKRYASRRLYNSDISEYVTLTEVAELIRSGRDVKIIDKKTGEDLTRQYLLQIISEQEANGEQAFPASILMEVIRTYKDQTQNLMPDFLARSYDMFKEQQSVFLSQQKDLLDRAAPQTPPDSNAAMMTAWQEHMQSWLGKMPGMKSTPETQTPNPLAGFDIEKWQAQQQEFFKTAMSGLIPQSDSTPPKTPSKPTPKPQPELTPKEQEIANMKAQLAELEKKLGGL